MPGVTAKGKKEKMIERQQNMDNDKAYRKAGGGKGRLLLIPSPLGDNDPAEVLPAPVFEAVKGCHSFVVEEVRTARRFLSRAGLRGQIDGLEFYTLNEHTEASEIESYMDLFEDGDVCLISEAGLPAVADPGAQLVALCHRRGVEVVPFVGPSSLMLALMSSGLNGQSFAFCGYLPAKTGERRNALRNIEKTSAGMCQSQIFIETPYRNDAMLADIVSVCAPSTRLCIAANITMPDAFIRTLTVAEWKSALRRDPAGGAFSIGKRPCVFVLLA